MKILLRAVNAVTTSIDWTERHISHPAGVFIRIMGTVVAALVTGATVGHFYGDGPALFWGVVTLVAMGYAFWATFD